MTSRSTPAIDANRPSVNCLAALLMLALVAAGCSGTQRADEAEQGAGAQPDSAARANSLERTEWKAVSILGKPAGSAESTLGFGADGRVAGNGGCNRYQGEVTLQGNAIEFGLLATTRMMCAPPINGQETVFLEALALTRTWERSGNALELIDDTDTVVVSLTQQ